MSESAMIAFNMLLAFAILHEINVERTSEEKRTQRLFYAACVIISAIWHIYLVAEAIGR